MLILLLCLMQDAIPTPIPIPSAPVEVLPDAPQSHFIRDAMSHVAFVASTGKFGAKRTVNGGLTIECNKHVTLSGGIQNRTWAAGVIVHPIKEK